MRKQAKWMGKWDDRLLEFIIEQGSGAPTKIAESEYIPVSKQYVSKRLKELAENELLDPLGNGVYQITVKGTLYLNGDYNAQNDEILLNVDEEDLSTWKFKEGRDPHHNYPLNEPILKENERL